MHTWAMNCTVDLMDSDVELVLWRVLAGLVLSQLPGFS